MNRTIRAVIAVVLVAIITFAAISVSQNLIPRAKIDITEQKLYTLADGTKTILQRLNQSITIKLYYTKTAAMNAGDQIRFFNNYYFYVRALLEEYAAASNKVKLEIIDPRPYTDQEQEALRYGLKRFNINEEEGFFFGLVVQTQFGATKTIEFFSPDRQQFVEYDISYLIETATTREKKRLGVLSSLPVMGESDWMMRMRQMQNQQGEQKWGIIEHLQQKFDVQTVETDVDEIKDIDILLVIHPKELSEKTQFAIDQYVLKGGRAIFFVDPYCMMDRPPMQQMQMQMQHESSSSLETLFNAWGLTLPDNTFAGDRTLTITTAMSPTQRPQPMIGFLNLNVEQCFNQDKSITADLNTVTMLFPGVLRQIPLSTAPSESNEGEEKKGSSAGSDLQYIELVTTTGRGNSWTVSSPFELRFPDPATLMKKLTDGTEPVAMGMLITGKLPSAFPQGIDVEDDSAQASDQDSETPADAETKKEEKKTRHISGLAQAELDCAIIVFADVDFISDMAAYQRTIFGMAVVGDNAALVMNSIDDLSGSAELINIRSRGNFKRPFAVVDAIEQAAESETRDEEEKLQAQIDAWQNELNQKLADVKDADASVIGATILQQKRELEDKIFEANQDLRNIKMKRREKIEALGVTLRNFCTIPGPVIILLIAVVLGIRRSVMKRHYISHASDA
ncbi:MAG: GldG family protein [Sedimentisphaerales bacterium]|nr:GldG family protein [Sedimentisphaerales bacterium]